MRSILSLILSGAFFILTAQGPLEFIDIEAGELPQNLTNSRSAIIISMEPLERDGFKVSNNWKKIARDAHRAFKIMGVDPIVYMNDLVLSSDVTRQNYFQYLKDRKIRFLVFLKVLDSDVEINIIPFDAKRGLTGKFDGYKRKESGLQKALLELARDIKRQELVFENFLVPEKPSFSEKVSIVEKQSLANYPGQIRRSLLAIEKFDTLKIPVDATSELRSGIAAYNKKMKLRNKKIQQIFESQYPFDFILIDKMSDEMLLRKRYQFVLRNISGTGEGIKSLLNQELKKEDNLVSVIPILPDQTTIKLIPREGIVTKFYIKQNITKNVHTGIWDADEQWEKALENFIGHVIMNINKS